MNAETGLIFARKLDRKGSANPVSWKDLPKEFPEDDTYWLHFDYENQAVQQWICSLPQMDEALTEYLLHDDSRPGVLNHGDQLLLALRAINFNDNQDPEDLISIRCYITPKLIITLRRRKVHLLQTIRDKLDKGTGIKDSNDFIQKLLGLLINEIGKHTAKVDDRITNEELSEDEQSYERLIETQKELLHLSRFLHPQKTTLQQLSKLRPSWFREDLVLGTHTLSELHIRYVEDLDFCLERTRVMKDELNAERSETMNQRLYLLALVSVIFLPLTVITGLLGVNLAGIPYANHYLAFFGLCLLMALITALILFVLRKNKWF